MMSKLLKVLPAMLALLMVSMPAFADDGAGGNAWQGMAAMGAGLAIGQPLCMVGNQSIVEKLSSKILENRKRLGVELLHQHVGL